MRRRLTFGLLFGIVGLYPLAAKAAPETLLLARPATMEWTDWKARLAGDGVRVLVAFPPDAAIVSSEPSPLSSLERDGTRVLREPVSAADPVAQASAGAAAVATWNRRFERDAGAPAWVPALGHADAIEPPVPAGKAPGENGVLGAPAGAGFNDTSEFMMGEVAVGIVLPESNGLIDLNRENWTLTEMSEVVAGIGDGLVFWAGLDARANLSFVVSVFDSVPTAYEPIRHGTYTNGEHALWINQCMAALGFSTGDLFNRTREFDNALRDSLGTDWGICVFVVDSSQDTDGRFSDFNYAYSYFGGPFLVMTYDNWTWGIGNMNAISAHEITHQFYALDEYASNPCTDTAGYLGVQNQNQMFGCALDVDCLMRTQVADAYAEDSVCWYTRGQLGWRDADADSILDILDTHPETALDAFPDTSAIPAPTFTGTATLPPLVNVNPRGAGNDITLAHVAAVEYRVDGGPWSAASAADGDWDEVSEGFELTPPPLSEEPHLLEVRAVSSVGNADATPDTALFDVSDVTAPSEVAEFTADAVETEARLGWRAPVTPDVATIRIRFRTDAFPAGPEDGELLGDFPAVPGALDSTVHSGISADTLYYYAAFARDEVPNASAPAFALGEPLDPAPPADLFEPLPGSLYVALLPSLRWAASVPEEGDTITAYALELATDSLFTSLVLDSEIVTGAPADTFWTLPGPALAEGTRHFLRIRAKDLSSGTYGHSSAIFSFTTALPLDSLRFRDRVESSWSNVASGDTLAYSVNALLEVGMAPADPLGVGGHAGRVLSSRDGGAAWDTTALVAHHTVDDTTFFRAALAYGALFAAGDSVLFRFEGWDGTSIATPQSDAGVYLFHAGQDPVTGVSDVAAAASEAGLFGNAPNPFRPATRIAFRVAAGAPQPCRLAVFDGSGRLVKVLVDATLSPGPHEAQWDGSDARGRPAASGVYVCELRAGAFRGTHRMTLVR